MVVLFVGFSASSAKAQTDAKQKSLYERLGKYDGIAAFSDEFIKNLGADKTLQCFLVGLSEDSQKKLRQHLVDFLCNATGGPCLYVGRDMKTVHKGLGITEKDWEAGVNALVKTLDSFKIKDPERTEVINAVSNLKKDIVEK
jgi:hemoglobin